MLARMIGLNRLEFFLIIVAQFQIYTKAEGACGYLCLYSVCTSHNSAGSSLGRYVLKGMVEKRLTSDLLGFCVSWVGKYFGV